MPTSRKKAVPSGFEDCSFYADCLFLLSWNLRVRRHPDNVMDRAQPSQNPAAPIPISAAACTLWLLALIPFAVPALFFLQRSEVRSAVAAINPSLSREAIDGIVNGTIIGSMAILGAIAVLYIWLAGLIRKGENRARIALTVLLVITTAGGWLFSEASSHLMPRAMAYVMVEQGSSLVLRVVTLCLLWVPASSSKYFVPPQSGAQ
jgi:hypothetical protein